jgi:RNA polymerase sigma factor (sigma-70 family)
MGVHLNLDPEIELIERCRQGNHTAQRQLYERYAGRLFGLCCRYIKDRMEAEDVLVTGFTKILSKLHQYKGDGSFEGWMKRVIINEALTYLRRSRHMYLETDLEAAYAEPDYHRLHDALEAEDVLRLVAELPAGYRTVFNLYAIEGYNHQEIGEMLGISENTSKSQLSRARAMLIKQLEALELPDKKKVKTINA